MYYYPMGHIASSKRNGSYCVVKKAIILFRGLVCSTEICLTQSVNLVIIDMRNHSRGGWKSLIGVVKCFQDYIASHVAPINTLNHRVKRWIHT